MSKPTAFTWDEAKAVANAAKHGIRFETATEVFFASDRQDVPSPHAADPEPRTIAYGTVDGLLLAVVYTFDGQAVRIISARRANRTERKRHGQLQA